MWLYFTGDVLGGVVPVHGGWDLSWLAGSVVHWLPSLHPTSVTLLCDCSCIQCAIQILPFSMAWQDSFSPPSKVPFWNFHPLILSSKTHLLWLRDMTIPCFFLTFFSNISLIYLNLSCFLQLVFLNLGLSVLIQLSYSKLSLVEYYIEYNLKCPCKSVPSPT